MYKCKFRWPNDAKIAVVFNMSWESWDDTLGTGKDKERGSPNIPATSPYTRGMRWVFEHSYGDNGGLLLKYADQLIDLNHLHPRISLGRDVSCDIVVDDRFVSREHATIELDGMDFYLVDRSINGTYIAFDGRPDVSVLRRDVLLGGAGKISVGRAFAEDPQHVIMFFYDRRSLFRV